MSRTVHGRKDFRKRVAEKRRRPHKKVRPNRPGEFRAKGRKGAELGEKTENLVENLLRQMRNLNMITDFTRCPPRTPGKDFVVIKGHKIIEVNVTCSLVAYYSHKERFPGVFILYVPQDAERWQIAQRILRFFEAAKAAG